jgi:hypothetical protein
LKLLALQGLQHSDPEQAVPMLEKILQAHVAAAARTRALRARAEQFAEARQIIVTPRKVRATPICSARPSISRRERYRENREALGQIYEFVHRRGREAPHPALIRHLGRPRTGAGGGNDVRPHPSCAPKRAAAGRHGAHDELWQLYQKESSVDVKKAHPAGDVRRRQRHAAHRARQHGVERGSQARGDSQSRAHGLDTHRERRSSALYAKEKEVETRKAIVQAFFLQNNAEAARGHRRKESDPVMRKEIVSPSRRCARRWRRTICWEILNK